MECRNSGWWLALFNCRFPTWARGECQIFSRLQSLQKWTHGAWAICTIGRLRDGLPKQPEFPGNSLGSPNKGSVVIFSMPSIPYGKALRQEFFDYLADEKFMARSTTLLWPIVRWVNSILMLKREDRFAVVHYTERVISKLTRREFHFKRIWSKLDGALFCFCVNRTAETYSRHLSK